MTSTRIATPEEIAVRAGQQVPHLLLPAAGVFAERETRLRELSAGHAMRGFLLLMAELARAQHEALADFPAPLLPGFAADGLPPLPAVGWARDPAWRHALRGMLERMLPRLNGDTAAAAPSLQQLLALSDEQLEQQADRLLGGVMLGLDMALAPLVAGGLQVYWTAMVQVAGAERFDRADDPTACPCCGSGPTASVSRIGGEAGGYRYLRCALCSAQWHMVRIKCTHCQGTKGIGYQSLTPLEGPTEAKPVVQAETCETCGHYLKIVHMERNANVEPVADDLATLTLDLLVSETGLQRHGVNLLLLFGDPEPGP